MKNPAFESATALAHAIRERRIGSLELLELFAARVERHNPALNAIVVHDLDRARGRARSADEALARGEIWGPLHGVPITVKEAFNVEGLPTTWGDPALTGNVATSNATAVDSLLRSGAVIFGKTNVPFLLSDWQTFNAIHGTTNNPWDLSRAPGGSSGGAAAALAAGLTGLEMGSDIGSSIRNPAHYCGVYGHKPSFGVVPQHGHGIPAARTPIDILVCGPLARSADDLDLALTAIAGPEPYDRIAWQIELPPPRRTHLRQFRVAVLLEDRNCRVDTSVTDRIAAIADAVGRAGAKVTQLSALPFDTSEAHALYLQLLRGATGALLPAEQYDRFRREASQSLPGDASYRMRTMRGATQSHRAWFAAHEQRHALRRRWSHFFEEFDLLLCPPAASAAFPHDQNRERFDRTILVNGRDEDYNDQLFWAGLASLPYLPATVAPAGLTSAGLPVGVQIIGPYLEDRTTIAFARALADDAGGFVPPPGYT